MTEFGEMAEEEEEKLLDGVAVLDFDMLCSTVAMQMQAREGKWEKLNQIGEEEGDDYRGGGGVFRMWEGDFFYDCSDDPTISLQSACCPCYRFGKNMRRAGFGPCFLQGSVHFILIVLALLSMLAHIITKRHYFLYAAAGFTILTGAYLGFHRTLIRKKFNIKGSDSSLDDCINHLICPCCTLSQESRTLEMNNVQDGIWHGRGDTICIGSYPEGAKGLFELNPPPVMSILSPEPYTTQKITSDNVHL